MRPLPRASLSGPEAATLAGSSHEHVLESAQACVDHRLHLCASYRTRSTGEWHVYTAIFDHKRSEVYVDGYLEGSGKSAGSNGLDGLSIGCDHNGVFYLVTNAPCLLQQTRTLPSVKLLSSSIAGRRICQPCASCPCASCPVALPLLAHCRVS